MDTNLLLAVSIGLNTSHECSGTPKFADVYEIGDFRQGKAKNSDKSLILQAFGKYSNSSKLGYCPKISALGD